MLKRMASIFGFTFIAVGILGFIPGITTEEGRLLGIFEVDAMHNMVHILSGIVALFAAYKSEHAARLYFQVFGVVYGLVAVLGIFHGDRPLLGLMAHNGADVVLHFLIAGVALYLGFHGRTRRSTVHA
jgi:hypothetical protein